MSLWWEAQSTQIPVALGSGLSPEIHSDVVAQRAVLLAVAVVHHAVHLVAGNDIPFSRTQAAEHIVLGHRVELHAVTLDDVAAANGTRAGNIGADEVAQNPVAVGGLDVDADLDIAGNYIALSIG